MGNHHRDRDSVGCPWSDASRQMALRVTRKLDALQTVLLDLHDLNPVTEYRFAPPRRFRFDVALLDHKIAVEVDGATWVGGRHTTGRGHQSDAEKRNLAQTMGWRVFTYNAAMIERGDVRRDVDAVLEGR